MYRILFIETGEYLYCVNSDRYETLYSTYEIINIHRPMNRFKIYETDKKDEAINKLSRNLAIELEGITIDISANRNLFEIVEV